MKRALTLFCCASSLISNSLIASDAIEPSISKKGESKLAESFDGENLGKGWTVQTGDWKPVGGALRGKEIAADQHSAAARRLLPMQDGVYQLRFRLTGDEPKGFHFGFDPAPGQLPKKGHLFSVIVEPKGVKLLKHIDKAKPKEDPNETLATAQTAIVPGEWHTLLVEKVGNQVAAQVVSDSGTIRLHLAASHSTFHVKTPTLVFRCLGDGVEIDDIQVWDAVAK